VPPAGSAARRNGGRRRAERGDLVVFIGASVSKPAGDRSGTTSGVDFSIHDLRRTFARLLAEGGVPATRIRDYLGHESVATTESYYLGRNRSIVVADNPRVPVYVHAAPRPVGPNSGSESSQRGAQKRRKSLWCNGEDDGARTRNHRIDSPVL
jgi:hypothetical protein